MKKFDVITRYATYPNCYLNQAEYADNNHIYLSVWSEEEGPISNLTVNVRGIEAYPKNFSCVDINNFPEADAVIRKLKIGKATERCIWSGMCMYPIYEFNMTKINEAMGKKVYIVEFEIHTNFYVESYCYFTYASNAKEACKNTKEAWRGADRLYNMHAVKSRVQNPEWLNVVDYRNKEHVGRDNMEHFTHTNSMRRMGAMKKYDVSFEAGDGIDIHGGVNFMLNKKLDLYAEIGVPDGAAEDYGYLNLKNEIIRQAKSAGIDPDTLHFLYDGKEKYLSRQARVQ